MTTTDATNVTSSRAVPQTDTKREITRRKVLGAIGVVASIAVTGCVGSDKELTLSVPGDSQYFKSINYSHISRPLGVFDNTEVDITFHAELPAEPSVIILYVDGKQADHRRVALGESQVSMYADYFSPSTLRNANSVGIAAVRGGDGDREWTGGEILERVEPEVREAVSV